MKIPIFLLPLLALAACLKPNEDGSVVSGASVFSSVTSSQVEEAYILNVADWGLSEEGLSVFTHLVDDEYFGLQVLSSTSSPIRELTVQLGKDLQNLTNFLSINGILDQAQSLKLKLPFSLFNSDSIFLAENAINYSQYTYGFQKKGNVDIVEIPYEILSDGVFVNLTEFGTIVVAKKACENIDASGVCNDLVINGPDLDLRYYHDKKTALRKFTWINEGGDAYCSVDGGSSYASCATETSHILTVAQFNSKPVFKVKIETSNGTVHGSFDLANASTGYPDVHFYVCNVTLSSGNFDLFSDPLLSVNDNVICLADNAVFSNTTGTKKSIKFKADNIKIIGDHVNRALISNLYFGAVVDSSVFVLDSTHHLHPTVANVKADTVATTAIGHVVYLATTGTESYPVFSNVEFIANDSEAVLAMGSNNPYFYDSHVKSLGTATNVIRLDSTRVQIDKSKIEGLNTKTIVFGATDSGDESTITNSTIITQGSSTPAIYFQSDPLPPYVHLFLEDNIFSTNFDGVYIEDNSVVEANDNLFRNTFFSAGIGNVFVLANVGGIIQVNGLNNSFCVTDLNSGGFDDFENSTFSDNNSAGALQAGVDVGVCP